MSDDKSKRGFPDNTKFNKNEPYEVNYAAKKLQPEFPAKSVSQIKKALVDSAKVPQFHQNRKMIINSARMKLGN